MKKLILLCLGLILAANLLFANYFSYLPYLISQPDGEKISCFVSGDEFFNWIHDQEGYTIIQAPDGYFYYGEVSGNSVVPTKYKVNSVNPSDAGLTKWAKISYSEYQKVKSFFDEPSGQISNTPQVGTLNNIVIYIRFSDDTEFTDTRQTFDNKFNLSPGTSLKTYFTEASYNQFNVSSTHYPACAMTTNLSYQDPRPRSYFQPYNASTNTNGYSGGDNGLERTQREHSLLKDAINWINANSPVPGGLNIDSDNDGYVDNVCFNIRGGNGGWAALLWAHSWILYSLNVTLNGKRVYRYTFQPETQVSVQTLCHEMFHSVGSPDLYHYSGNGIAPVSSWDLMESGFGHMGAYMKWKYTNHNWISSIPEITTSGTYTLNPLTNATNNCYKIASPNSITQFFIVEYRKKVSGTFENNLPGSGLLVYRIDPSTTGNASGPPDEVYIYRPGGTISTNGSPSSAFYSSESGRTDINDATNPSCYLQNGSPGGLAISNITSAGNTISFTVGISTIENPLNFTAIAVSSTQINLQWQKNTSNNNVLLAYSSSPTFGFPTSGNAYFPGDTITGGGIVLSSTSTDSFNQTNLLPATTYYYKLWSYDSANKYSNGISLNTTTPCETISSFPWSEDFENGERLPNCWIQEQVNNSGVFWTCVSGNGSNNPNSAHAGKLNACLKDLTSDDNKSRLITPVFNLSSLGSPTLTFWHTQQFWPDDQDILTVFYKTAVTGTWNQLATYTNDIPIWTQENISLPFASSNYYISFEGNAKYGYGICIDDVEINGIQLPANFEITNQTVTDNESECYDATDTIFVAGNNTDVEFLNGSSVDLIAGKSIFFLPGFHAFEGSNMNAFITTEAQFCGALPVSNIIAQNNEKSISISFPFENKKKGGTNEKVVKIYPNPNDGQFTVNIQNFAKEVEISVLNMSGKVIYRLHSTEEEQFKITLPFSNPGLYYVRVSDGKGFKTGKIVVY
jgi:M6 family metalloprotease-like protein